MQLTRVWPRRGCVTRCAATSLQHVTNDAINFRRVERISTFIEGWAPRRGLQYFPNCCCQDVDDINYRHEGFLCSDLQSPVCFSYKSLQTADDSYIEGLCQPSQPSRHKAQQDTHSFCCCPDTAVQVHRTPVQQQDRNLRHFLIIQSLAQHFQDCNEDIYCHPAGCVSQDDHVRRDLVVNLCQIPHSQD